MGADEKICHDVLTMNTNGLPVPNELSSVDVSGEDKICIAEVVYILCRQWGLFASG